MHTDHCHDCPGHHHDTRHVSIRRLRMALAINSAYLVVEAAGGLLSNSLALLADAGHMLTDVAALAVALVAARLALLPPNPRRTFGLLRAEVLGAFLNGATLVVIVGFIAVRAYQRLASRPQIEGPLMLAVAVGGLVANIWSAAVLFRSRKESINVRGAFAHMVADALGSVGTIIAGGVIWLTGWVPIDAVASVTIGALILWSGIGLLKESTQILLQATPLDIDYDAVLQALVGMDHVVEVYDLHIWTITSGIPALSAHLRLEPDCSETVHWQTCLNHAQTMLREQFGIVHSTLQLEPPTHGRDARPVR
ncbi:MAG: cation diffusion facilitator family transporter, partial [Candidatus Eisenbacteria bacterium]|nr:cation diffusion facilitator family transporter [Candidatus Eisenbacteria bacterium]